MVTSVSCKITTFVETGFAFRETETEKNGEQKRHGFMMRMSAHGVVYESNDFDRVEWVLPPEFRL